MSELKISEGRYINLIQHENECRQTFINVVFFLAKKWQAENPTEVNEWGTDKKHIADYINKGLEEMKIVFNGKTPSVWFNSSGYGIMMYWDYSDSATIHGIDEVLKK